MPVGANIRVAPVAGEAAPAAPVDAANLAELFGQIISCLAAPAPDPDPTQPGSASAEKAEKPSMEMTSKAGEEAVQSPLEAIHHLLSLGGGSLPHVAQVAARGSKDEGPQTSDQKPEDALTTGLAAAPLLPDPAVPLQAPVALPLVETKEPALVDVEFDAELATQPSLRQGMEKASPDKPADVPLQPPLAQLNIKADAAGMNLPKPVQTSLPAAPLPLEALVQTVARQLGQQSEDAGEGAARPLPTASTLGHLAASLLPRKAHSSLEAAPAKPAPPAAFASIATAQLQAPTLVPDMAGSALPELAPSEATPQPEHAELVVEHQLDLAHEGEWLDQLARDISEAAAGEGKTLRFRLNPETLGTLRVEIAQDRQGAAIRLTADTEAARSVIADAQPRLLAEARAQGLRISEAHVDLGGQSASEDPRRQRSEFEEAPLRTARSLQDEAEGDGKPTPRSSERYA